MSGTPWYRDRAALAFFALGYLPWLAALNLAWESLHVPLYTLWKEAEASYIAFAVVHCTLGDVMIGGSSLGLALIVTRAGTLEGWRWRRTAALTAVIGTAYTAFSEWMNVELRRTWAYSELMPTLEVGGIETGLSPLLQWILLPPLALYLGRRARGMNGRRP